LQDTEELLATIVSLQPRAASLEGGQRAEDKVLATAGELEKVKSTRQTYMTPALQFQYEMLHAGGARAV
jgi:hypothetical protein